MPGFHSKKEKRQAKHIIAGYKKRGVSSDTAKHIAWATVNKQKNEDWQFNGAGQPVFIGKDTVSQFDPSGTVSPGQPYLPDEVAKMLVKESGLRKMDTVPKRVIVRYLESMGLSSGLAVDVARVLRDVYGIAPIFDEETLLGRSGALIEELTKAVSESFPMPFIDDSEPRELTEVDLIGSFIQNEFIESKNENYDLVLGHLAMLSPGKFQDVVTFYEAVGPEMFDYLENLVADGQEDVAEHILNGISFPNTIKFMPEHVQALFDEDAADDVIRDFKAKRMTPKMPKIPPIPKKGAAKPAAAAAPKPAAKPAMQIPKIKKQPAAVPSFKKQMALHGKDLPGDKLAAKKPGEALSKFREKKAADKAAQGGALKRAGKAALGVMKKVHSAATTPKASDNSSHDSKVGSALKSIASGAGKVAKGLAKGAGAVAKGAGKALVHTAGATAGAAGHVVGAAARGVAHGFGGNTSSEAPKEKKGLLGHLGHAIGRFAGHVKKGFQSATPGIQSQMKKDSPEAEPKKEKKRVAQSAVGESRSGDLLGELQSVLSEDYPDLGKTPYGPAGDPKKGPQLAKDWMTPQPAGSMEPHGGETTRMFSDPDDREKARKAKLADVMQALDSMRQQAAAAGVNPEGMFLNLYRDMHREKVRYS